MYLSCCLFYRLQTLDVASREKVADGKIFFSQCVKIPKLIEYHKKTEFPLKELCDVVYFNNVVIS
jgi:hypothetical protein